MEDPKILQSQSEETRIDFDIREKIQLFRERAVKDIKREREEGKFAWPNYDSPLSFYRDYFQLPEGCNSLLDYLNQVYKLKLGKLKGMEIGGTGSRLFADLNTGHIFEKSLGVTLVDTRDDELKKTDDDNSHDVVPANAFLSGFEMDGEQFPGWEKVEEWINKNGKVDLIIEDMKGPMVAMSYSDGPLLLNAMLRWYQTLEVGGTMFVVLPATLESTMKQISVELKKVNVEFDYREDFDSTKFFRLRRLKGSPESLDDVFKLMNFNK